MSYVMSPPALARTVRCKVAAASLLCASAEMIAVMRKQPLVIGGQKLPVSFLKHADNQTVLALTAVLRALETDDWKQRSFTDWGVVAAPNMFGRMHSAQSIQRFKQEGAWGVSPHLIPHQSLHGMSGLISQALKIQGPNFGIAAAGNSAPDAILVAGAMVMDGSLPGLWVVLVGYESEWIPAPESEPSVPPPMCQAVAFALTPADGIIAGPCLAIGQDGIESTLPEFNLNLLTEEWTHRGVIPTGRWHLGNTNWIELDVAEEGDR